MLVWLGVLLGAAQAAGDRAEVARAIEPSPTPISWELEFKYIAPRRIEVNLPGSGREVYWYLVYTVTNRSATTQKFHPTFELMTDDLRVIPTDTGISPLVFDAIRERHKRTHPYLVHPTRAIGELRVGDDYAIESVAIWRASDLTASRFSIFVAGLSGEARLVPNPAFVSRAAQTLPAASAADGTPGGEEANPRYFTLRKTLELEYLLPGSMNARQTAEPQLLRMRWIMR